MPEISSFLNDIDLKFSESIMSLHDKLTALECKTEVKEAKSGHVVSYHDPHNSKAVANFVSRKKGPQLRFYGDNMDKYISSISLPPAMSAKIEKSSMCKRLADPAKCNSRCPMGFQFNLNGSFYQKCRYNVMLDITDENLPAIKDLLENEISARA